MLTCIKITIKRNRNHMVSQTAHTKKLCEPFMAHLENLYNIPFDAPGTIIFFFGICLRVGGLSVMMQCY